jgi:vitamin B12 transporter
VQPDTFRLREVVVTATRLPTPLAAVPAAVTVITGEELRARGVRFVADALRTVPGANLAGGGSHGAITSLFLRGGEADYVQVLIDGVQANEPGGSYDFAHLSTHDIERIEIVRGPVSVLYGSDAVAGVIQIFTREGSGAPSLRASIEAGRYGRAAPTHTGDAASGSAGALAFDASLNGATNGIRYSFGAAQFDTNGLYAENNAYLNRSLSARLTWRADAPAAHGPEGSRWSGVARSEDDGARSEDDGARSGTDRWNGVSRSDVAVSARWTDNRYNFPTDGAGRIVDLNQFNTGTSFAAGAEAGHFFTRRIEARVSVQLHRHDTGFDDRPDSPADTLGSFAAESEGRTNRRSIDARANLHLSRAVLTLGGAAQWQDGWSRYLSESEWGPFESASDDERSSRAVYGQLLANPLAPLTLTLGARVDDSDMFGAHTTWRAGANVRVTGFATLRAAAASAFKEPTFYENFASGFVTGNAELRPERSESFEIGAVIGHAGATFAATAYRQRFTDMIQYDARPREERAGDANYFNLAAAAANGFEIEATASPGRGVELRGGYNFVSTDVRDAGVGGDRAFLQGERLLRRPAHSGSIVASAPVHRLIRIAASTRIVGARDDLDFADDWQGERDHPACLRRRRPLGRSGSRSARHASAMSH